MLSRAQARQHVTCVVAGGAGPVWPWLCVCACVCVRVPACVWLCVAVAVAVAEARGLAPLGSRSKNKVFEWLGS